MKKYIYSIIFLLAFVHVNAQNLCKHKTFFKVQKSNYEAWLNSTGINQVLSIKRLKIKKDKVTLILISNYKNDDSFNKSWKLLNGSFFKKNNYLLPDKMLNMFLFLLELEEEEGEIHIYDNQFKNLILEIRYIDNEIAPIDSPEPDEVLTGGTISISLDDLNFPRTGSKFRVDSALYLSDINSRIDSLLRDYFSKVPDSKFYTPKINRITDERQRSVYYVTCLRKHLLKSRKYYEKVRIEINIEKKEVIEIIYDITGMYASGWICHRERDEFYTSMEVKYAEELERFANNIAGRIKDSLTKPIRIK